MRNLPHKITNPAQKNRIILAGIGVTHTKLSAINLLLALSFDTSTSRKGRPFRVAALRS